PEALARLFSQARLGPPPRSPEEALTLAWQRLVGVSRIEHAGFGHIGQNHIHLNLLPKDRIEEVVATELYRKLAHLAVSLGGSVSAEHGIGKRKRDLLELQVGRRGIERMRKIKQALDPGGILCSGNLFPET
ncbi:MAG: FAD-binding oxidoreductase, partial [Deltaproteobacteria bacterium]